MLTAIHHLKGDSHEQCNRYYRFAAYKQYIWWVYGRMVRRNRKVVPLCVVRAIQKRFPEKNGDYGKYIGFFQPPRSGS